MYKHNDKCEKVVGDVWEIMYVPVTELPVNYGYYSQNDYFIPIIKFNKLLLISPVL